MIRQVLLHLYHLFQTILRSCVFNNCVTIFNGNVQLFQIDFFKTLSRSILYEPPLSCPFQILNNKKSIIFLFFSVIYILQWTQLPVRIFGLVLNTYPIYLSYMSNVCYMQTTVL